MLGPVDLEVNWADRVAVVGANGAGKTTPINALLGRARLDEGSSWLGSRVVVGEIDQARDLFNGDQPLLEAFSSELASMSQASRAWLLFVLVPVFDLHVGFGPGGRQGHGLSLIHISEPTRLGMISYAVFCLKKKK